VTDETEYYFVLKDQMQEWLEERCDRSSHESYTISRELHQDFAKFMLGRGFVPSEQVFVARFEGIEGCGAANGCQMANAGFGASRCGGTSPSCGLSAARRGVGAKCK
jgi:hypothetical protein